MNGNQYSEACGKIRPQLAMLLYGELSFDEEELVEAHLESCQDCRVALEQERKLSAAFDEVAAEPSPALLAQCRQGLSERLLREPVPARSGFWGQLVDMFTLRAPDGFPDTAWNWMRPAGAVALIAVGFLGARLSPGFLPGLAGSGVDVMSLAESGAAKVRSVEQAADGRVQIVLDETRQRTVSGNLDDDQIRGLLLAATTDPTNPARVETVAILTTRPQSTDVRSALLYAIRNDEDAGVRLKAMEGLKSFSSDPDVQDALAEVLLTDSNPGMRTQAIDLLMQGFGDLNPQSMDRDMIGVLQELMSREDNPYVRQRSQTALELVNASAEIF